MTIASTGDELAPAASPEVVFQGRRYRGEPYDLAPGAARDWRLRLVSPIDPGTFPAVVRVRAGNAEEGEEAALVVVLVATPGASPSPVRAAWSVRPIAGSAGAQVRLENPEAEAVAGRVVFVLPPELRTQPESQPARVPARGTVTVPLMLERTGAGADGDRSLHAVFEYTQGGMHHTVVAAASVPIAGARGANRARPLAVGAGALALALALALLAVRRAAPPGCMHFFRGRRPPRPPRR